MMIDGNSHSVSVCLESGEHSNIMMKLPLLSVLKEALLNAPENKQDCWLISNGYNDKGGKYTRAEHNFDWVDTILLDVDNGKEEDPSTWDRDLLEKFKREHEAYDYFLWQTASSTIDRPKFRAILLLDEKIPWVNEPRKYTKSAIQGVFSKWNDDHASWFFTPTKGKIGTFFRHLGKPYPSSNLLWTIKSMRNLDEAMKPSVAGLLDIEQRASQYKFNPEGWRNLPSVKHCLEGLAKGDRDKSINAACYAMKQNNYGNSIHEFLDELSTTPAMMDGEGKTMIMKFKNKHK